jgi:hypothetical protein
VAKPHNKSSSGRLLPDVVMSYVQRVLQPGEQVRHISSIQGVGKG